MALQQGWYNHIPAAPPDLGMKLRVPCSTDWANQADCIKWMKVTSMGKEGPSNHNDRRKVNLGIQKWNRYYHWGLKITRDLNLESSLIYRNTKLSQIIFSFFSVPRRTYICDFLFASFRFQGVCECCHYLYVSGPLDFRLVIQVLTHPCMILNACVHRRHPCLTSLAEDVALPQE